MAGALLHYHRRLFQWHCRQFFRFRRHLSEAEKAYLEVCFELPDDYEEISETGYQHFSYYTYSHRVDGEKVNSSRLAYGSVIHPQPAMQAALPVLAERAIEPISDPICRFYGLGWDIDAGQFKVYYRCPDMVRLPDSLHDLTAPYDLGNYRSEGLISFTYQGQNQLCERKVYLYPLDGSDLPSGASGQAAMLTDARGNVPQYDVEESASWEHRLNPTGQQILRLYRSLGEELDTIAYQDPDHFTLYFP